VAAQEAQNQNKEDSQNGSKEHSNDDDNAKRYQTPNKKTQQDQERTGLLHDLNHVHHPDDQIQTPSEQLNSS